MLLSVIKGLNRQNFEPIVLLPYRETLDVELEMLRVRVLIGPVAVLRRQLGNPKGLCIFISNLIKGLFFIRKIDKECGIDAIYTNTSPVLSGAIYAKLSGKVHIWHIHEITTKPILFKYLMPKVINFFSDICITTSNATKGYVLSGGINTARVKVVYNGIAELKESKASSAHSDKITAGMVGRFNWLKGQEVFVKAAHSIIKSGYDMRFLIVGSCFKNEEMYFLRLKDLISNMGLDSKIEVMDFIKDLPGLYTKMDIVVIPTTQPESFGLVAAEAMSMKKPVVASDIGGLPEVVINGKTGILFEPGNDEQLKDAILKLAKNENLRHMMGNAGFERQQAYFTEVRFQKDISRIIAETLGR